MTTMSRFAQASLLCVVLASAAGARDAPDTGKRAALFAKLVDCKAITDAAQRLACFDQSVDALDKAEKENQLVIMDRAQVREARRSLFGFSLPKIKLFGGADDKDEIDRLDTTVAGFNRDADGRLLFTTAEGASWRQIDDRPSFPKSGMKVTLQKAMLGAYYARLGLSSVKVIRTR